MPLFAILCRDSPNGSVLRREHLDKHLAYMESVIDSMRVAGPLGDVASLLLVEAPDQSAAEALIRADPYAREGVWSEVEVMPFRAVAGSWVGWISWEPRADRSGQ